MAVDNRKMFKPRNARNKLNQMGGIMASSPELMNTVQRFDRGGTVRIPIQALADVSGRGFIFPTSGNMPVPYNPGFTTPGGTGGAPVSQGPTSRAQRDPTRPVPSNRALVPVTGPEQSQSKPSGIRQFLTPAARLVSRTPVASAIYGGGRAILDPLDVDSVSAFEPRSVMGIDPSKRRDREFFLEDFEAMSEEQQQAALDAENASRGASRALATAGRVAGVVIDPLLELGQDVFNMDVSERMLESSAAEAQQRNRPLTMEEYRLSLLSKNPERNKRILNDRRERVKAAEAAAGKATQATETASQPATSVPDLLQRLPNASDIQEASPEAQYDMGKVIQEEMTKFLGSEDVDENEKNDVILTMLDKKQPGEKLSKAEQIKKNREAYRELFGMDPEKDKQIDGYNLAMMGFLIASGDSPNALQNIARGAAAGLKNFQKTAEKRQAREDKLTELAVREYENTLKSEKADEQFRMDFNLKVQELQDRRDQAATKAEQDRFVAIIDALGDSPAAALAFMQLDKEDVDVSTPEGMTQLNTLTSNLIAENPALAVSRTRKGMDPKDMAFRASQAVAQQNQQMPGTYIDEFGNFTQAGINLYNNMLNSPAVAGNAPPSERITLEPDAE